MRTRASRVSVIVLVTALTCHIYSVGSATDPSVVTFDIAAVPHWAKTISADINSVAEIDEGGISHLLVDRQENLEPPAFYYHEVRKIVSENGVQNGASITVSFDPSYEKLIFHSIQLFRNGVTSNRLDRSKVKLLQREKEMERFVYDGSFTAQCELEDVRVGDVIEFAYTIEGANPVKRGKYSSTFHMQWSFPVRRSFLRLTYPVQRKIHFLARNWSITPTIRTDNGRTEWITDESDIPGRKIDNDAPEDFYPHHAIQFTEFTSWGELVEWALPLFRTNADASEELKEQAEKFRAVSDPEQRVLAALRFMQDEIRYLGIESGAGSHRPAPADQVLRRRFGDCKDKVLLLATLLQRSGIDAVPALVSTSYRNTISERLPSPDIFDHAIVQVRLGQGIHWIDPTRANQRGPLSQVYVANYGRALVLRPDVTELTTFKPPTTSWPKKKVIENYRVPAPEQSGELDVITEYCGLAADRTRTSFRESTREEIQKNYLEFYARTFPDIKLKASLRYEELTGENSCRVTESYTVPKIWQRNEDANRYQLFLYPSEINTAIGAIPSPRRSDPLALDYPNSVREEISVEIFEDWPLNVENENVANRFFRFVDETTGHGRRFQLSCLYETLADRVEVGDLPKYAADLTKVKDALGYQLSYATPQQLKSIQGWRGFNWPIAVALAPVLGAAVYLSGRYFRRSKLAHPLPPPLPSERPSSLSLEGVGGWLVLVAIGLVLTPLRIVAASVAAWTSIFNLQIWRSLTDPGEAAYHPLWAPALLFELFFNSLFLIFSILLIALFFKRRAAWRRCYIVFLIANLLAILIDTCLIDQIPAAAESATSSIRDITGAIVGAAIWVPYALRSKRVKATFRY